MRKFVIGAVGCWGCWGGGAAAAEGAGGAGGVRRKLGAVGNCHPRWCPLGAAGGRWGPLGSTKWLLGGCWGTLRGTGERCGVLWVLGKEVLQPVRALGVFGVLEEEWGALKAARATGKLLETLGATGSH